MGGSFWFLLQESTQSSSTGSGISEAFTLIPHQVCILLTLTTAPLLRIPPFIRPIPSSSLPQCPAYTSDILCSIISILSQIFFPVQYTAPKLICYQTPIPTPQLPTVTCITSSLTYLTHNPTERHNLTTYIRSFYNHWKSTLPIGTCSQPCAWFHNLQLSTAWPSYTLDTDYPVTCWV